jgi:hypothetical protein
MQGEKARKENNKESFDLTAKGAKKKRVSEGFLSFIPNRLIVIREIKASEKRNFAPFAFFAVKKFPSLIALAENAALVPHHPPLFPHFSPLPAQGTD